MPKGDKSWGWRPLLQIARLALRVREVRRSVRHFVAPTHKHRQTNSTVDDKRDGPPPAAESYGYPPPPPAVAYGYPPPVPYYGPPVYVAVPGPYFGPYSALCLW